MGVFEDTSIRILSIHRQKYIGLGSSVRGGQFGSRLIQTIYKVQRYDTSSTAYVLVSGASTYKKNEIVQNANWRYVSGDMWDNSDLTDAENESQIGGLPIVDDNPQQ
jgi:hypothetical protein